MSSPQIEREIRTLLNREGSPEEAARELIKRWQKNLFDPNEQASVAQFFLNSGLEALMLEECRRLLQTKRMVPWLQFVAVLSRAGFNWSQDELRALHDGLRDQNAMDDFAAWPDSAKLSVQFSDARRTLEKKKDAERDKVKEQLRDQLYFFRNQRMYEEESAALQKLKALYPDDPEFKIDQKDLSERWARDVLANYSGFPTELTEELLLRAQELPAESKSIKDHLTRQAMALAEERPESAYNLALMFLFMEFYSEALKILELSPSTPQKDWLRLDLLLKARQYVTVLDEAGRLELLFSADPESTFSVTYARARALWGLGQSAMAIELIRSIVRVRPNYRSARSLLLDWSGGET